LKRLSALLLVILGLCACSPTTTPTLLPPTPDVQATGTQIAARISGTQTASVPTPTRTNTPTPIPTSTPTPTSTLTPTHIPPQITTYQTVNVRQGPGVQFAVLRTLRSNTLATIIGKNAGGGWFQIAYPDSSNPGWVSSTVVRVIGSVDSLPVIAAIPLPKTSGNAVIAPQIPTPRWTATKIPPIVARVPSDGAPANPWGYNFTCCKFIYSPPPNFCSYFGCIENFWKGNGYVIQCKDGTFSKSGGLKGSCSSHGGNNRPLYAP
jgi:uncharacterized protein YraI